MCIHTWRDKVCEILRAGVERAESTGSEQEPTAIASFSVEILQQLLEEAPKDQPGAAQPHPNALDGDGMPRPADSDIVFELLKTFQHASPKLMQLWAEIQEELVPADTGQEDQGGEE